MASNQPRIKLPPPYNVEGKLSESDVNEAIREATADVNLWRINPSAQTSTGGRRKTDNRGMSDWIGFTPDGRFVAIEAKRPAGTASLEQIDFLRSVFASGGLAAIVCTPEGAWWICDHFFRGRKLTAERIVRLPSGIIVA